MVRLELDQVVMRRMKEDDIEAVKALIKITMPRSTGVLGSSRPSWDYVGSSYRGTQDETLQNPYCRISGKTPVTKRPRRRIGPKEKDKEMSTETITPEREQAAGQVWVADCESDIIGCIFRESENRAGIGRICRCVTGSWYRREGLGRLLVQSLEQRERESGAHRVYAHVPYPSKVGEVFFRKLGYRQYGEGSDEEDDEEMKLETPERGFLGYPLTKVFFKDL
ncbi:probable N-acetyltransferase 14 isoform X2 [Dicentrarchus labrax]|uniref:probable N-acetyltransferase 14 isoform X2 n=1 Tax=Dicentrarchus labrax TaxID=13489 RepID=UPI0021F50A32|nr:probable N-acetyltransferase 14 isoform X2 [Dicentrarchus labrax]